MSGKSARSNLRLLSMSAVKLTVCFGLMLAGRLVFESVGDDLDELEYRRLTKGRD